MTAIAPLPRFVSAIEGASPLVLLAVSLAVIVNGTLVHQVIVAGQPSDWGNYTVVAGRIAEGRSPYDTFPGGIGFAYNPLMALAFAAIVPFGFAVWTGLHILAAALMPRPLGIVALVSFPFWWDLMSGSVIVFVVLVAAWALRGHGWAIAGTFVIALLMPRPIMVPLVVWLLWKHPEWRIPALCIAGVVGLATLATGYAFDWLTVLPRSARDIAHEWNMSPSRWIGVWWLPIGVVLAALFLRRGMVGLASMAVTPYLLPYYVLFALLDLSRGWSKELSASSRLPSSSPRYSTSRGDSTT